MRVTSLQRSLGDELAFVTLANEFEQSTALALLGGLLAQVHVWG